MCGDALRALRAPQAPGTRRGPITRLWRLCAPVADGPRLACGPARAARAPGAGICLRPRLPPHPHLPPQLALLAGGTAGSKALRREVAAAQKEQARLCAEADAERRPVPRRGAQAPKVAVDAVFFARIRKIMAM